MSNITNPKLGKLHEEFITALKLRSKSQSTVIAYSKDIEQLLNFLSDKGANDIKNVTLDNLEAFKMSLQDQKYTPKSISRKINSIRTFYRHITDKGYVIENPAEKLVHPKFEIKPPRVLSEMEYRALRDVCRIETRLYSIIEILLQTGVRISELANLFLDDVRTSPDGKVRYLFIREFGSHPARKVPLNKSAHKAIEDYLAIRPETEDEHLFVTKTGNPLLIRNIRTTIDKAFERSGIKDAKVNDLRNTFIAHHLANGVSLVTVSKISGHKRISTTEKYLNLLSNGIKAEERNLKEL